MRDSGIMNGEECYTAKLLTWIQPKLHCFFKNSDLILVISYILREQASAMLRTS